MRTTPERLSGSAQDRVVLGVLIETLAEFYAALAPDRCNDSIDSPLGDLVGSAVVVALSVDLTEQVVYSGVHGRNVLVSGALVGGERSDHCLGALGQCLDDDLDLGAVVGDSDQEWVVAAHIGWLDLVTVGLVNH